MREFVEDKDVQMKFKEVCLSRSVMSLPATVSGDIIIIIL
jgi:hypothetical protein